MRLTNDVRHFQLYKAKLSQPSAEEECVIKTECFTFSSTKQN